jgi:hypothetical protein
MEENIEQTAQEAEQIEKKRYYQQTDEERVRRQKAAALARERTARRNALGLNARGGPRKNRHNKNRNDAKQRQYQHNFAARHKAARERLGLTISEFNKLPQATRLAEYNRLKGKPVDAKERNRAKKRSWYHENKEKVMAARRAKSSNGPTPVPTTREVKFCPHCGWNIDATRKAQAFIDGRAS